MFSQLRMREEQALLAHDYALEQAEEKGLERGRAEEIEEGLKVGLVNLVRQQLLSSRRFRFIPTSKEKAKNPSLSYLLTN